MTDAEVIAYLVGAGRGDRVITALVHSDDTSGTDADPITAAVATSRLKLGDNGFAYWVARGRHDAITPAAPPRGWRVFCPYCGATLPEPGADGHSWCGECKSMVAARVQVART